VTAAPHSFAPKITANPAQTRSVRPEFWSSYNIAGQSRQFTSSRLNYFFVCEYVCDEDGGMKGGA
jgi:hypothetical protein